MMYIKTKIYANICGSLGEHKDIQGLLKVIDEQFVSSDKALASTLMTKFLTMKFIRTSGVREHIMQMRDIAAQLNKLEIEISESFLVHFILNSLPS